MSQDGDPVPPLAAAALLALLIGWVAFQRWQFLASSPYPWGIDGYFYPIQVRALLEGGTLRYPSPPLSFWLMAPLAAAGGVVWSVKVVAAVGTALIAAPIYGVCRQLDAERGPALLAATLAATASASFYFSVEFVKNGVGLTMAMLALWAILAAHRSPTRARWIGAAVAAVAAWLTHKSAAALVVIAAAPLAIPWLRAAPKKRAAIALALLAALIALALVLPGRFVGLADLGLLGDLVGGDFDWRLPVLSLPEGRRDSYGHAVPLAAAAAIVFWVAMRGRQRSPRVALVAAGLTGLVAVSALPILDVGDPNALGFRLRLLAFIPFAIIGALAFGLVLSSRQAMTRAGAALAVAGFVVTVRPATYLPPVVEQHPALVAAVSAAHGKLPEDAAIVTPERRLVFMATWFTNRPAAQNPASFESARIWRLIPLPYISGNLGRAIEAERQARDDGGDIRALHPYAALGLVLLPEATWQRVLARLEGDERARYQSWPTY